MDADLTLTEHFKLLQIVVEESPIATVLYSGPEMTIRLANNEMLKIWNKDRSVIGKTFSSAMPQPFINEVKERLNRIYKSGVPYELTEQRLDLTFGMHLNSSYSTLVFKPLKSLDGKVWGILVTAIDVSALVTAKNEVKIGKDLHQNDQEFRTLMAKAPAAIGIFKGWDMVIESANDALLELWGKDADVIGLPLLQTLPEIQGQPFIDFLRGVYTTGKPYYRYEILSQLYRKKHLKDVYYNFVYQPVLEPDGTIKKILVIANDVTAQVLTKLELKESESRFKNLILESPVPTAIFTDYDLVVKIINSAMLKVWGKDASVVGMPLEQALPELAGQPILPNLNRIYTTGIAQSNTETKADLIVDEKLQTFYFNVSNKPLVDAKGKVYGILNMAMDITGQVQARKELEEVAQKKDEFLSVASHELKTPLTSVKASMQIIKKLVKSDPTSAVIPVFIHKANTSLIKITRLIEDLMHVSKVQQGQMPLNKSLFNLTELVNDCCEHVRTENSHKIILTGQTELLVNADQARIDQVIINFVNNAVKYAPDSKKIILNVEKVGDLAKVSVLDFGIGVSADKQQHLFDRYYRVDSSGVQFSGLGLGLYISADIIERHGGKIGVESTPGNGSTFWFTLPL